MLLNEYKRNFFRLLNEGAAEMYRDSYYPEVDDYILEKIIEIDPESNGDDLSDFGKLLLKLNPQMSDFKQLRKDIEIFAKAVRNGVEVPDVKTVEELHYAAVDLANSNAHMSGDEINAQEESLGCPTVYSDGEYRVIDICNKDAAAYYGKGTMWIWGANDGNMFDQYSQRGKIYVILKGSEKFSAIRMGSRLRITDAQDENVSKDMFPQEMLTALTGVNENKNVRLSENELMDMLVEAVENKMLNNSNNNNMSKIKLTESRLKKMISEAVKKAINEIAINDAYTKFYQDIPQEDFDKIVSTLQSGNDNLLPETKWVLNLYKRDSSVMMDLPKVNNIIKFFNRAKQRGMIKGMEGDLNRYKSISELGRFVNSLKMDDVMSPTRSEVRNYNNTNGKNEIETVYQDGEWQVIIPKTFAASCYWGKGTSWDTAHRIQGERYFDYYSNMSPLYIFVNKQTGEKYQYHNEVGLIDSNDHEVNPQEVGLSEILDEVTGNSIRESRKRNKRNKR